jgi:hypothetical protein
VSTVGGLDSVVGDPNFGFATDGAALGAGLDALGAGLAVLGDPNFGLLEDTPPLGLLEDGLLEEEPPPLDLLEEGLLDGFLL